MRKEAEPRFGIDLDGVVYAWEPMARQLLAAEYDIAVEESQAWDSIKEAVPADAWRWLWQQGLKRGLFLKGESYPAAIDSLKALSRMGRVIAITNRPRRAISHTYAWLALVEAPFDEVHILDGAPKSSVPCDLYVDDKDTVIKELRENTNAVVLLWDRPWNQACAHEPRVSNWQEVLKWARRCV